MTAKKTAAAAKKKVNKLPSKKLASNKTLNPIFNLRQYK